MARWHYYRSSLVLLSYLIIYTVFGCFWLWYVLQCFCLRKVFFFWCPCMAINISVQYKRRASPRLYTVDPRLLLIPSGIPFKWPEDVLSLQPITIPPKRFDISPLCVGCSEGLDAFRFFFKLHQYRGKSPHCGLSSIEPARALWPSSFSATVQATSPVDTYTRKNPIDTVSSRLRWRRSQG